MISFLLPQTSMQGPLPENPTAFCKHQPELYAETILFILTVAVQNDKYENAQVSPVQVYDNRTKKS